MGNTFQKRMGQAEALNEARKRWGVTAFVKRVKRTNLSGAFNVGHVKVSGGAATVIVCGSGRSWEEAFTEAETLAAKAKLIAPRAAHLVTDRRERRRQIVLATLINLAAWGAVAVQILNHYYGFRIP